MKNKLIALSALSAMVLSGCKDERVSSEETFDSKDKDKIGTVIDIVYLKTGAYDIYVYYLIDTDSNKQDAEYIGKTHTDTQLIGQAYNAKKIGMQKPLYQWAQYLKNFQRIQK